MGWSGEGAEKAARAEGAPRRLLVAAGVVVVVLVAGTVSLGRFVGGGGGRARGEPARAQGGFLDGAPAAHVDLSRHETLAPRAAVPDPSTGERVAPFEGFGVSVESTPGGARVLVAGAELGETPLVASVRCAPGDSVEVRVEKRGWRAWSRRTRCRSDALVALDARLER